MCVQQWYFDLMFGSWAHWSLLNSKSFLYKQSHLARLWWKLYILYVDVYKAVSLCAQCSSGPSGTWWEQSLKLLVLGLSQCIVLISMVTPVEHSAPHSMIVTNWFSWPNRGHSQALVLCVDPCSIDIQLCLSCLVSGTVCIIPKSKYATFQMSNSVLWC